MDKRKRLSILIPDGEDLLLMPVVNCLASTKQYKIYVLSNDKKNPMRYSRNLYHFEFWQGSYSKDWIQTINDFVKKYSIDHIFPIFETGIHNLIKYKHLLQLPEKLIFLPELKSFENAIDKGILSEHLNHHGIPGPKGQLVAAATDLKKIDALRFPVIAKPTTGYGGGKHIHVFHSLRKVENYFRDTNFFCPHIVQEYIVGYDIDCSVLCKNGQILAYTIQKGNVWEKTQFSPACGVAFLDEPRLYEIVARLIKSLHWSGIAHIDLRFDEKDNNFKIIELNPRFWLSVEASLRAGVNFPDLSIKALRNKTFSKPKYSSCSYLNLRGIKIISTKNIGILLKWQYLLKNTSLRFVLKDPIPVLYKFLATKFKRLFSLN